MNSHESGNYNYDSPYGSGGGNIVDRQRYDRDQRLHQQQELQHQQLHHQQQQQHVDSFHYYNNSQDVMFNNTTDNSTINQRRNSSNSGINASTVAPSQSKSSVGLSQEAKRHLSRWINLHRSHPYPDKGEKDKMLKDLGLGPSDLRKLEGWFSRARKKLKECTVTPRVVQAPVQATTTSDNSQISPLDVEVYLKAWMSRPENMIDGKPNLSPNVEIRDKMSAESGIESRRIESWFYRLRKKVKKQDTATTNGISLHPNQKVSAMTSSIITGPSNATFIPAAGPRSATTIQAAAGPNSITLNSALAATGHNVTSKQAAQVQGHSTQTNQMNQSTAATASSSGGGSTNASNFIHGVYYNQGGGDSSTQHHNNNNNQYCGFIATQQKNT
eukprot:scaffold297274_cov50-Cyclotella_meneghiniana.AAC.1